MLSISLSKQKYPIFAPFSPLLLLFTIFVWFPLEGRGEVLTLRDAFQLGEERSELLLSASEEITQAEILRKQLLALSLPSLQLRSQVQWQDQSNLSINPLARPLVTSPLYSVSLQLLENPLTFYKEYQAISSQDLLKNQRTYNREALRLALRRDILKAYYTILHLEATLRIQKNLLKVLDARLSELKSRYRIGKSRRTELLAQEIQIAQISSAIGETERSLTVARNLLAFLIGVRELQEEITRPEIRPFPPSLKPIEAYLSSLDARPELLAQKAQVDLVRKNIEIARAGHFPLFGASANYYLLRNGFSKDIRWDIGVSAVLPLFSFGAVDDQIYIAESQARQAEILYHRLRRQLEQDLRNIYNNLEYGLKNLERYHQMQRKAEENYHLLSEDFSRGMAINLEVLDALYQLINAQLNYSINEINLEAYALELRLLTGEEVP